MQITPLKRLGEPDEFADVEFFLVQHSTHYLTDQVTHVGGGLTVGISAR